MIRIIAELSGSAEYLARRCNEHPVDDDACPVGHLSAIYCPFPGKSCGGICPGDWEELDCLDKVRRRLHDADDLLVTTYSTEEK